MFGRVKKWVRDVRIDFEFQGYENECRLNHERNANRRFSTQELDKELEEILREIQADADKLFGEIIEELNIRELQIQSKVYSREAMLAFFTRNYKEELDALNKEKSALYMRQKESKDRISELFRELSDAKNRKNESYAKVKEYAEDVDSWHSKSKRTPWLGGNKGSKIPNHSIFGQSHGDRYSDEYERDKAYEEAQKYKAEIKDISGQIDFNKSNLAIINENIGRLKNQINAIMTNRNRMFELKKEGYSKFKLQREISEFRHNLNQEQNEHGKQIAKRVDYITASKHQRGVIELENIIKTVQKNKDDFIQEFSLAENHIARKEEHRTEWLKQRNMS